MTEDELALGVHSKLRAAALSLERHEQFGPFNPGRTPVPMRTIASAFQRSVEVWRTGEVIRVW